MHKQVWHWHKKLCSLRKLEYVEKQGFNNNFLQALDKNEEIVKGELLNYVDKDDLESQEKFSNALNRMDTQKII